MSEFHLKESKDETSPRVKTPPKSKSIPVPFSYQPSDDGTDENLLILLHGLGDTHIPFAKLGKQLKLPQTAVLALRATEQVPFLYEDAYQWYTSFDELGEMIERPNPTPALDLLSKIIDHLTRDLKWPLDRIHFFGFSQGGSVAAEFAIHKWKQHLQLNKTAITASNSEGTTASSSSGGGGSAGSSASPTSFASIVTISGPLLSYPTLSQPSPTPLLLAHRPSPSEEALKNDAVRSFQKGFQSVTEIKLGARGRGMPASKEEWEPIMRFWSEKLSRKRMDGLYEVMSGMSSASSS